MHVLLINGFAQSRSNRTKDIEHGGSNVVHVLKLQLHTCLIALHLTDHPMQSLAHHLEDTIHFRAEFANTLVICLYRDELLVGKVEYGRALGHDLSSILVSSHERHALREKAVVLSPLCLSPLSALSRRR